MEALGALAVALKEWLSLTPLDRHAPLHVALVDVLCSTSAPRGRVGRE
jgi:hypothetical protein